MPKINLAQEAIRNQIIARRRRLIYVLSVVILVLVVGVYGVVLLLTNQVEQEAADVEAEVSRLQSQLDARKDDVREVVLFRERLKSMDAVLAKHIRWSRMLEEFERLALPTARFSRMDGDVSSKTLNAEVVLPSVDAAADILASFKHRDTTNETFFTEVVPVSLKSVETTTEPGAAPTLSGYKLILNLTARDTAFVPSAEVAPASPAPAAPSSPAPAAAVPAVPEV